jgi:hypothetical protein
MAYSKSKTAKQLGISKDELNRLAKEAGFKHTEDYVNANGGVAGLITKRLRDKVTKEIVAIDRQLDALWDIGLTDAEKQQFLDKAIAEVEPYYTNKKMEIEKGIQEGSIRTAEDILVTMREIDDETTQKLAYYDLENSQTEEEFITRLADITSSGEEDKAIKLDDWRQRVETAKVNQIQTGIFSSGVGQKKRLELENRKQLELQALERKTGAAQTAEETAKKYNLEQIKLARQAAEAERTRILGSPEQQEQTRSAALATTGYSDISQLPSETELQAQRTARGVSPIYDRSVLTDLESQRLADIESTKLELENQRKAEKEQEYERQRQKLLADRAAKYSQISGY